MAEPLLYLAIFMIWFKLLYHIVLVQGGYQFSLKYEQITRNWVTDVPDRPTVSILIPAYNEEVVIEETIRAMTQLNYPKDKLEIIVINDNSTDQTGSLAESFASIHSNVKVVHNQPPFSGKGKSGSLNRGLKEATGEIIVVYDADNTPEQDAVHHLVLTLQKDKKAGAAVGKFRVTNAKKNLLTRFINIETITFQWLAQAGRWFLFKLTTIPGTNFAIRKSVIEKLGGWDERALSEDTELSIRVYNLGWHIRFNPSAITWEQEPETLSVWWRQRTRWARGNMYVVGKYLMKFHRLQNKKVFIDLVYFLLTYFMFVIGILISHTIFIGNLFFDLDIAIGSVSYVLLGVGFLLFVTEILLALSIEENQLNLRNGFIVLLMYVIYSQLWLFLILYSAFLEMKRLILKQDVVWYKTERFAATKTVQVKHYETSNK